MTNLKTLKNIGISDTRMAKAAKALKYRSGDAISRKFSHLKDRFGDYTNVMINKDPDVLAMSEQKVDKIIDFFTNYGFNKNVFLGRLSKCPRILKRSTSSIKSILGFFESKNFAKEEIIKLISKDPGLLLRKKDTVATRYKALESRMEDETKRVVLAFPAIVRCYGVEAINKRLDVFEQISGEVGMKELFSNPIRLSYNPDTVMKRFNFFKSRGLSYKELFISKDKFKRRFGIEL